MDMILESQSLLTFSPGSNSLHCLPYYPHSFLSFLVLLLLLLIIHSFKSKRQFPTIQQIPTICIWMPSSWLILEPCNNLISSAQCHSSHTIPFWTCLSLRALSYFCCCFTLWQQSYNHHLNWAHVGRPSAIDRFIAQLSQLAANTVYCIW